MSEDDVKIEIQGTQNRLQNARNHTSGIAPDYCLQMEILLELKKVRLAILETAALNIES